MIFKNKPRTPFTKVNKIIAIALVIIMLVPFLADATGIGTVYAEENAIEGEEVLANDSEENASYFEIQDEEESASYFEIQDEEENESLEVEEDVESDESSQTNDDEDQGEPEYSESVEDIEDETVTETELAEELTVVGIVFDDNMMTLSFDEYSFQKSDTEDYYDGEFYEFIDAESIKIGDVLKTHINIINEKQYEPGNITFYCQVLGDKSDKKYKIENPKDFNIALEQANSIIVITYDVRMTDRVYVNDNEVYDQVISLDRDSCVKILSTPMVSEYSYLKLKDPTTATWKISTLSQEKSNELLEVVKDEAVYFNVNAAAISALGTKPFAIERTENGKTDSWSFIINGENPEITVKNLDNTTIYAGQEKSFTYEVKGSKPALTKENVKIYKENGMLADENNIQVKEISSNDITIAVSAVDTVTDKATYYIDIVNSSEKSLLKSGKKLKLNVAVLDSRFTAKNIEYVRSDEDNIYFKVKGLSAETESLYTDITVEAKAVVATDETINEFYKDKSEVVETFKNDAIIKVPVKVDPADERDDKGSTQKYSFTFSLSQNKTDGSGVYKKSEVKLSTNYANIALYYETNLKVKAIPAAKNVYTGQSNVQIATPIFSKESSSTTIIYLKDDLGQIETNNYGEVEGNAYDPESGKLVINIPASVTPGKHVLTFVAYAPNGFIASKTSITINVKIGIESVVMIKSLSTYYLGNRDINIKTKTRYYNITHAPMYESVIKPTTCKAVYSIESDNEYLLSYITINPSNGNVKISKDLAKVYDRIKAKGTTFRVIATANDYPGTEIYQKIENVSRVDKWEIEITTDGISDYLTNNKEIRAFIDQPYYNEYHQLDVKETPTDVAVIDKNNKKRTQFTIQQANKLTFKVYRSASDPDEKNIHTNVTWKVSGSVLSYRADSYGLHIDKVKPGIITVTAIAADGSGKGSISRSFEVKKDDYKLRLVDVPNGNEVLPTDAAYENEYYAFQSVQYMIIPFNDAETEPILEEEYNDHIDDMEHNYKFKISGGVILKIVGGSILWMPTEQYTKITLINNNKGSDGKKVQEDKVYTIHNTCFDKTESDFDTVKVLPAKTVANKYYDGKVASKIRFEVTNLPANVVDTGDGHTGYILTLAKSYKEKIKFPKPELENMIAEVPITSEIMYENGKYYVEIHQSIGEQWWQEPSDLVAGTYKLSVYIGRGDITEEDIQYVLNKKMIETTLTITPNNLKFAWEGGKTTKIKINGNESDKSERLIALADSDNRDTAYFKGSKYQNVAEVEITDVKYDLDTLNIFKEGLVSGDNLMTISSENGNVDLIYKAEDFAALKNAVVNAASGKTVKVGTAAQKAALKMTAKPDSNGNYDMSKVNPVIRGTFTYKIVGTDAAGYEMISNQTQNFEITLVNP